MNVMTTRFAVAASVCVAVAAGAGLARAQAPAPPAQAPGAPPAGRGAPPAGRTGGGGAYPQRPPPEPAAFERGKTLYGVHCALCHGQDARGAAGPSLIRSEIVLKDQKGELIAGVVRQGRPDKGMPAMPQLTAANVADMLP